MAGERQFIPARGPIIGQAGGPIAVPTGVTVCIPTRDRPTGLERLLSSLIGQQGAPPFDVLVVDNDPGRSAEAVVRRYADRLAISYATEPRPGVSSVRNSCVALSRAPLLAFIDDDEWAEPDWLAALYEKMADPGIAAAVGIRTFVFAEDVPLHRRTCVLFRVPVLEDGQLLAWNQTLIGNACLRRSALPDPKRPFDPELDFVGGEDSHLFARIIARGGRVVAACGAVTREYRSAQRTRVRDLLGRAYRHGGTGVEIDWRDKPAWRRLGFAAGSAIRFFGNACFAASTWFTRREYSFQRAVIAAGWAGRACRIIGWRFQEYRQAK
ncbi:MAG TPA: glycosyltransferase family 2 protein [Candidatus Polarisedimenticolia bacterium]|jgi:glycosyltransferase involved in cell wall biosynthesis|nr:glycosyltransferase family 2 protein [Candidatus Polarisedimenticolia bacterium]